MYPLAVPFFNHYVTGAPMESWLKRHEPKLFYGALAVSLLYVYFMASVECANYGNCWIANADLANWLFRLLGAK